MNPFIKYLKLTGYVLQEYVAPALTALIKIVASIASVVLSAASHSSSDVVSIQDDPITGEKIYTYNDGSQKRSAP